MRIAYFVHDVNDPAVRKRIRMLQAGGAQVSLLGFVRDRAAAPCHSDAVVLGYTSDARLGQRMTAVVRAMATFPWWRHHVLRADVVLARQLETLVLAATARRLCASRAPLIYECLDIHRLMLGAGLSGRLLRRLEASLLRECESLIVSSERFVAEHFFPAYHDTPRVELVENKVLATELPDLLPAQRMRAERPCAPWKIGWYGVIRCRRSLQLLARLTTQMSGLVEVTIRGRIARNVLPDFDTVVAETPGLHYEGPYDRLKELHNLYTAPHFFWGIDFYEAGGNSNWLLPNRLYEGGLFGAVPLAGRSVETGRWLAAHHAGVLLDEPLERTLPSFFAALDSEIFLAHRRAMASIPQSAFLHSQRDCQSLTTRLLFGEHAGLRGAA